MGVVGEQLRETGGAFRDVFRNRGLRRVNLALAGSVIGDWAYAIAVSIWAYQEGGATVLGLFGVARYVVLALVGPVLSTLADRFSKRAVMIGADVSRAALVVVGAFAIEADAPAALVIYGMALVTAALGTAFRPAQAALLPSLANDPRELTGANVVSSTIESVGFFLGPAIGALLLSVADIAVVYGFNAATFAWSALVLVGLPHGTAAEPAAAEAVAAAEGAAGSEGEDVESFAENVTAGFRAIMANRHLRLITGLFMAQTVVAGASSVYEVTIALELLEIGESGVGLLDSVLGIGGLIGGVVAMTLTRRQRLATDFGVGVVMWAAPLLLIVAVPRLGPTLLAMFLIGVANSIVDINGYTIMQRVAPAEVMGRVFGVLESFSIAGMAIGALVMPLLIETVGLRTGLAVVGAVVVGFGLLGMGGLLRIDTTVLAPPGLALLRQVPTLAALPAPVLERLAHSLVRREVAPGAVVFREGDPGDHFWIIESGRAEVTVGGAGVRRLGPGDSFGEIALLRDVPRTATLCADDGGLVLQGLERDVFIPAVTGHGEASQVADAVVERLLAFA